MHEKFKSFLDKWVDPVKADLYLSALECLESYGYVQTASELMLLLDTATETPVSDILDVAHILINDGLDFVLREHSLVIDGDVRERTLLLNALQSLVTDERHEAILDIIDNKEDNVEKLADLFEFVDIEAANSWADVISSFVHIPDGLIVRLKAIHEEGLANQQPSEDSTVIVTDEKRERFQLIRNFFGSNPTTLACTALRDDNVPVGTPLPTLINSYRDQLLSYEELMPLVIATHLVGLVLLSDTPLANVKLVSLDMIDDIYSDIDLVTRIAKAMETLLTEVISV